jgi:hypothetical protein
LLTAANENDQVAAAAAANFVQGEESALAFSGRHCNFGQQIAKE